MSRLNNFIGSSLENHPNILDEINSISIEVPDDLKPYLDRSSFVVDMKPASKKEKDYISSWRNDGFVVLDGADQGTSWKLAGQPGGTPSLAIRSTQKPTSALELVSTLSKSSISGDIHLVGQVGFGTVEAYWNGETSAIPGIIESARSAAHNVGGALMIERCPPELKSDLDVFGDLGAPLEIMRRMKQQYDPKGTLSPGRFAGRI